MHATGKSEFASLYQLSDTTGHADNNMKIKRSSNVFENSRPRRRLPIFRMALVAALVALLIMAWQRGGEQAQTRIEKPIPAEKLGH